MNDSRISRRHVLGAITAGGLGWAWNAAEARETQLPEKRPDNAQDALAQLKAGNERFVSGEPIHDHSGDEFRKTLLTQQNPIAVIIGCADSRVPIELIFDQGFGDLFVIRNAGNVVMTDVLGSVEYAVVHLHTPLVVVMGHQGCGAVTAALKSQQARSQEPKELQDILKQITPALQGLPKQKTQEEQLSEAVAANVRWSVNKMKKFQKERNHKIAQAVKVVGAVYSLTTGKVSILD